MLRRVRGKTANYGDDALAMWNGWSRSRAGIPANDPWLERFEDDLEVRRDEAILDLGCGTGADTLWLLEHGHDVLSADYAREALRSIERHLKGAKTAYVDMRDPLPFADGSFGVVVSSMALHYFDEATTVRLMREVRRILVPGGVLLARVSSVNDVAYGAGSGSEVETRYYDHGGYAQRYLNDSDVRRFFGGIGTLDFFEEAMTRPEAYYARPKMMWTIRQAVPKAVSGENLTTAGPSVSRLACDREFGIGLAEAQCWEWHRTGRRPVGCTPRFSR